MARRVLILDEVLAMLTVVGAPSALRERFRRQAEGVIGKRNERGVDRVTVSSSFGQKTQRGAVELTLNDERSQMEPKKAREIGLMLIEAAEAATSDEMLVKLLDRMGLDDAEARGRMLIELREIRQGSRDVSWPS
jgi:hypothetical protein